MREHIQSTLRAMVLNYGKRGHSWDHLDGEVCTKAADKLDQLEAELAALKAQQVGQEPAGEVHLRTGGGISLLHVELAQPLPPGTKLYTAPQPAPSQDVAGLVGALRALHHRNDHPGRFDAEVDRITSEALVGWEKTKLIDYVAHEPVKPVPIRHAPRRRPSGDYECPCGAVWDADEGADCPNESDGGRLINKCHGWRHRPCASICEATTRGNTNGHAANRHRAGRPAQSQPRNHPPAHSRRQNPRRPPGSRLPLPGRRRDRSGGSEMKPTPADLRHAIDVYRAYLYSGKTTQCRNFHEAVILDAEHTYARITGRPAPEVPASHHCKPTLARAVREVYSELAICCWSSPPKPKSRLACRRAAAELLGVSLSVYSARIRARGAQ